MKRRLRAYKKTVSIVNEKAIELYKGLGIEKKGFLLEGTDKESGQYTFMGVEPNEIIQSDKDSLVITRKDGSREVREGNPLIRLKEYFDEFEIVKDPGELDFIGGLVCGGRQILKIPPTENAACHKSNNDDGCHDALDDIGSARTVL